jgi:hypothetical protein
MTPRWTFTIEAGHLGERLLYTGAPADFPGLNDLQKDAVKAALRIVNRDAPLRDYDVTVTLYKTTQKGTRKDQVWYIVPDHRNPGRYKARR